MKRSVTFALAAVLVLTSCGMVRDSRLNPFNWFGQSEPVDVLTAVPDGQDTRLLVADVPQGYAHGIWSFLEKKFRNTEQDSVLALWERFTTLRQESDESFDVYKARVDSLRDLLSHAKEKITPSLYAATLVWKLP